MKRLLVEISEKDFDRVDDMLCAEGLEYEINEPLRAYCRAEAIMILDNVKTTYRKWSQSEFPHTITIMQREMNIKGADRDKLIEAITEHLYRKFCVWIDTLNRDKEAYHAIITELGI